MAVLQFPSPRPGARTREPASPSKLAENAAPRNIIERVKIDLDEDEIRRLIDAVDYYEAYLRAAAGTRRSSASCSWGLLVGKESRSRERNSVQIATHRGIDVSEM